ncbi:hypothetical protein [Halorubrum sp. F4]|uniref:hypothetical protein n=1 Tax=Halorubrum sp. F4 TaxID=2989715 RepID=UPI002480941B|nr:hypothetical protein [Halorubrum sp. F4]
MSEPSTDRYLETIQPDWDDLPLACELLELQRRESTDRLREVALSRGSVNGVKIQHVLNLLDKLSFLNNGELTDRGRVLADSYGRSIRTLQPGTKFTIGLKSSLSDTEQLLLWMVIYQEHTLPMKATLHQVSTERVTTAQDLATAKGLRDRIGHLYPTVNSDQSWIPRAKVHYLWLKNLGLARIQAGKYVLSPAGEGVFERVRGECPDEWDDTGGEVEITLTDFAH